MCRCPINGRHFFISLQGGWALSPARPVVVGNDWQSQADIRKTRNQTYLPLSLLCHRRMCSSRGNQPPPGAPMMMKPVQRSEVSVMRSMHGRSTSTRRHKAASAEPHRCARRGRGARGFEPVASAAECRIGAKAKRRLVGGPQGGHRLQALGRREHVLNIERAAVITRTYGGRIEQ